VTGDAGGACPTGSAGSVASLLGVDPGAPYTPELAGQVCDWIKTNWGAKIGQRGYLTLCAYYRDPGRTGGTFTAGTVPFCRKDDGTDAGTIPDFDAFGAQGVLDGLAGIPDAIISGLGNIVVRGALLTGILALILLGSWKLFQESPAPIPIPVPLRRLARAAA